MQIVGQTIVIRDAMTFKTTIYGSFYQGIDQHRRPLFRWLPRNFYVDLNKKP
jgi:hypothetical protein